MMARLPAVVVGLGLLLAASPGRADEPKAGAEITGVWESEWGLVTLKATPVKNKEVLAVTGHYVRARDQTGVIKSGTFDPASGVLQLNLEEPWNDTKGSARLTRAADGKEFKGHFSKSNKEKAKDEGMLHLTRIRTGEWKPADLAGTWDSPWGMITLKAAPAKDKEVEATVAYTGSYVSVTGKDHKGTLAGSLNKLTGVFELTLEEPWWGNETHGSATLTLGPYGNRLQGTYLKVNKDKGRDEGTVSWLRLKGATFATHLDSIIADGGITHDTPGAAVMVIEHGKVAFEKAYGLANLKEKTPLTAHTTCELASCTKQFTGTAILLLHERGKLDLDDDVRKYLPELPEYDKKNPIRILHLARHTSGLPEYMDFPDVKGKNPKYLTNEDYVGEFARQRKKFPLYFPTGSQFRYTNTNFMLLALIVERVSKKSFATFLKDNFFEPLGMKTAGVYESPQFRVKDPALGYHKDKNKFEESWGPPPFRQETMLVVGDGSVWASLEDLARWDEGWRQGKVLKPATIKTALVHSTYGNNEDNDYAFGWGVKVENGKLLNMAHNGGWGGFATYVDRNVEEDRTLIVLCNVDSVDMDAIVRLFRAMPPKAK